MENYKSYDLDFKQFILGYINTKNDINIQSVKEYFKHIYSLTVDLSDKNKFNGWMKSELKKKSNKFEMSKGAFKNKVEYLKDHTDDKMYQLVEINDNVNFLFDLNDVVTQFVLPRSEYFELLKRVQRLYPLNATDFKKIKNILNVFH
jgi:hypothetical protein